MLRPTALWTNWKVDLKNSICLLKGKTKGTVQCGNFWRNDGTGTLIQASPSSVLSEYSVLPQADFFHFVINTFLNLPAIQTQYKSDKSHSGQLRLPSIFAAGMNTEGNLLGSVLCFSKGLCTVHCPSIVPIKIFRCQEHFSITTSLSILTQQVFQEHFLLVALSNRTPVFNIYTFLPTCAKVTILG